MLPCHVPLKAGVAGGAAGVSATGAGPLEPPQPTIVDVSPNKDPSSIVRVILASSLISMCASCLNADR
jgi:hypothetical protein